MTRLRALWLTSRPPYPPDSGGKVFLLNRLKEMHRRGHEIHLVAAAEDGRDGEDASIVEPLGTWCESVTIFPTARFGARSPTKVLTLPWGAYRRLPDNATLATISALAATCDVMQVEQSVMIPSARAVLASVPLPTVLTLYSDGRAALRRAGHDRRLPGWRRLPVLAEAARLGRLERLAVTSDTFDHVAFVSAALLEEAAEKAPERRDRFHHVPVPIEVDQVPGARSASGAGPGGRILFAASFADVGNRLAYAWLVEDVVPLLAPELDARLVVAGRGAASLDPPPEAPVDVVSDPPDMGPHYESADVAVVPVVAGGGVRVKLLEAVARHVPVVSTSLGLEGTEFVPGEDLLVADTADDFAAALATALGRPEDADRRARHAYQKLRALHSPAAVGDQLELIYREACRAPREPTG
jgi:glycosyltransferase involved in cell wall biosynthesis